MPPGESVGVPRQCCRIAWRCPDLRSTSATSHRSNPTTARADRPGRTCRRRARRPRPERRLGSRPSRAGRISCRRGGRPRDRCGCVPAAHERAASAAAADPGSATRRPSAAAARRRGRAPAAAARCRGTGGVHPARSGAAAWSLTTMPAATPRVAADDELDGCFVADLPVIDAIRRNLLVVLRLVAQKRELRSGLVELHALVVAFAFLQRDRGPVAHLARERAVLFGLWRRHGVDEPRPIARPGEIAHQRNRDCPDRSRGCERSDRRRCPCAWRGCRPRRSVSL